MKDFTVHQARIMAALTEISKLFSSSLDYNEVANQCLRTLSQTLDLERGTLLMPTTDRKCLVIKASVGFSPEEIRNSVYKIGEDFVGRVFSNCLPMALPDADDVPGVPTPKEMSEEFNLYRIGFIAVPVVLDSRPIGVITAHRTSRSSTMVDEDIKVMKIVASLLSQTLRIAEMIREENSKLVQENKELHAELEERFNPDNLISNSSAMAKTLAMVKRVAGTDASVLLRGESGTGKTLLARSIHYTSTRQKSPFVIVNCAALPAGLIESELFGHEKGAFTGALNQRIGRFEAADQGTIFLDEIGEIPLETQAKLLSVIQDGTFERVGSSKTMTADVRLICATNANLEQLIRDKRFREDLYYRLMVVPINVPPLRSRREDVLPLASYFLKKFTTKYNKRISISREVMEFLAGYPWPGNVRELENTIERTVVLAGTEALTAKDIPILNSMVETLEPAPAPATSNTVVTFSPLSRRSKERQLYERVPLREKDIREAMHNAGGIQTHAARMLGVSLRQLRYALSRFGINATEFKY
ncbi:MAG: sigma 54-interacting transcriptional regulator [Fibrobacterota bacterium]|nr:sigma 54-interacting transcriptional regulator [Fibrobacterota bacterium]